MEPSEIRALLEQAKAKPAPASGTRVYVVKKNDTFSSIARKELGGVQFWRDIQRMNKNVKPTKLHAGDKIKLPNRRQSSKQLSSVRPAA